MPRYSVLNIDDDVFYTPGDDSFFKQEQQETKPIELELETAPLTEQEKRAALIIEKAKNWKPIDRHDDFRAPDAANEGGFILDDPVVLAKFRSALKDLIG